MASEELVRRLGAMRVSAELDATEPTRAREQLLDVDGAIRTSASLAGKPAAERRAALNQIRPGTRVTIGADGPHFGASEPARKQSRIEAREQLTEKLRPLSAEQRQRFADAAAEKWSEKGRDLLSEALVNLEIAEDGATDVDFRIAELDEAEQDAETDEWIENVTRSANYVTDDDTDDNDYYEEDETWN